MPTKTRRRRRPQPLPRKPRRMSSPASQENLIDELDSRQNAVLERLAELNARVEALLNECLAGREARTQQPELSKERPSVERVTGE